jgi:hypothetical protein
MKKILLVSAALFTVSFLSAQQTEVRNANGSYYRKCVRFRVTEPLSKLAAEHPTTKIANVTRLAADASAPPAKNRNAQYNPKACLSDGALQNYQGSKENKAPIVSINGAKSIQGYVPLDPNGMIGSNYYVQTVNSDFAIYDKTGSTVLAETDLSILFGSFTCDDGDPVTLYDRFADRWIITEFQQNAACNLQGNIDTMMMAVSATNDPTGNYYIYYFCPDNADFADYPKYSIWADGYYQTCNCQNDKVVVYQRDSMLAGSPNAGFIVVPFNETPNGQEGFFCPMTMYADGQLPPYGSPNFVMYFNDDNWGAGFNDELVIDSISIDWKNKTGSLGSYQKLATAPFDSYFSGGGRGDIDQPKKIGSFDALDGFISYRIPYLRWGNHNTAVMCYPVNVSKTPTVPNVTGGTELAGVRWYEIRQDTTSRQWSIFQQGTYAPNDSVNRWNPAIAMDANGSIGLCYSVSDKTSTYPGMRYTGRTACDSLNVMSLQEGVGVTGNGTLQTYNRWGDYSHTSVDPIDGITFWHTNMYALSGGIATRIFSFRVPTPCPLGINGISEPQITLTAFQSGNMLNVKGQGMALTGQMNVDIYDALGKHIMGKTVKPGSNMVETSFNVQALAKGIYYVRLGNDDMQRVAKVVIN